MLLPGVTPFPPEFAARYRDRGYWEDRPLIAHFLGLFADYAHRAAIIDDEGSYTYAELADASQRVALNLLDLGLEPTDRVVVQLPNTRLFASFYFALQRIGAIPIMALPSHRYRELRQFVTLGGAVAAAAPEDQGRGLRPAPPAGARGPAGPAAEHPAGRPRRAGRGLHQPGAAARAAAHPAHARRPRARRRPDRPGQPRGLPAVRRDHRRPETHPAHA